MSMRRQKAEYRVGTGATSMLMIFVILCLTTLSVLAVSTARSDMTMTKRNATMVKAYYDAANQVQRILAQIDEQLHAMKDGSLRLAREELGEMSGKEAADAALVEARALDLYTQSFSAVTVENVAIEIRDGKYLDFSVDAGYDRLIEVTLELYPLNSGQTYEIVKHRLAIIDNWEPDFGFGVYQEGSMPTVNPGGVSSESNIDDELELLD